MPMSLLPSGQLLREQSARVHVQQRKSEGEQEKVDDDKERQGDGGRGATPGVVAV